MALIICPDCQHSISDASPACIYCGRPINLSAKTSEPGTREHHPSAPDPGLLNSKAEPFFAPVAIHKLIVMSIFTLGLYQIHWFYMQWDYVRRADRKHFNPALRAILSGIFAYSLFRSIKARGLARRAEIAWSPGLLTIAWWFVGVLGGALARALGLLDLLGVAGQVLLLTAVQRGINRLNDPSSMNRRYSAINVAGIVAGAALWCLAAIGAYSQLAGASMHAR